MPPTAAIVSQGDEIVTGQTVDTNAAWLAEQLTELGFDVVRHVSVGDRLDDLVAMYQARTEDLVLSTGGLGPTDDDLTAEAIARAFDAPLQLDEAALAALEARYASYGRVMPAANRKQVCFPTGATRLDNAFGTAPGFAVNTPHGLIACLPGVPREMKGMFAEVVRPLVLDRLALTPARLVTLRTAGAGESNLQDAIGHFSHPGIVLGYRTSIRENQIKLRVAAHVTDDEVRAVVARLQDAVGDAIFAIDGAPGWQGPSADLPTTVGQLLGAAGHTIATAESCTGGRIAALFTEVPGSSAWFLEGAVTYSNAAKMRVLGVPPSLLEAHGAVSEPVARAMAEGIRVAAGTTYGLSSTGIAGPGGGSDAKPVGTVHLALATPNTTVHRKVRLPGSRTRVQDRTAVAALDLLRRHIARPS